MEVWLWHSAIARIQHLFGKNAYVFSSYLLRPSWQARLCLVRVPPGWTPAGWLDIVYTCRDFVLYGSRLCNPLCISLLCWCLYLSACMISGSRGIRREWCQGVAVASWCAELLTTRCVPSWSSAFPSVPRATSPWSTTPDLVGSLPSRSPLSHGNCNKIKSSILAYSYGEHNKFEYTFIHYVTWDTSKYYCKTSI